jgi:protein-L-isoaspartate(D-aspartate) O-methyltransferase
MNRVAEGNADGLDRMIRQQITERGITNPRLLDAIRAVPRELFVPQDYKDQAFADRPSPFGFGQTISQPYMVALMTDRLDVQPTHKVLEIGTGSGYQTAILAHLAREVWSVERVKPLLDEAFERLMSLPLRNIRLRHGDGTTGWPEPAPFDRILIAAGAPELPRELLLSHLVDGGIAVLPVGPEDEQMLVEVRRRGDQLDTTDICPCRFVKLIGQHGWSDT